MDLVVNEEGWLSKKSGKTIAPPEFRVSEKRTERERDTYALSFTGPKMCQHKKTILLNAKHLFIWHKMFVTATIYI